MKIIKKRTSTYIETYTLSFMHDGSGYGFDCDKDGNVDVSKLNPIALESYKECQTGYITRMEGEQYDIDPKTREYVVIPGTGMKKTYKVSPEIRTYGKMHHEPAIGECDDCGAHVQLHGFTNTCDCGADYNMSGQRLADRSQWGFDTGESLSDILSIP